MLLYRRVVWWYLAAPVLLFLLTWDTPAIGLPLFFLLLVAIWRVSPCSDAPDSSRICYRFLLPTVGLAVFLTWGAMVMNFFDWPKHRSVFYDLSRCHWPIAYDVNGTRELLSFYLMYYLPPAMVAKISGLPWLPRAIELWTELGYALALWGYFSRSRTKYEWLFLFFLVMTLDGWIVYESRWRTWSMAPHDMFLYQFYWVPQHVIPMWLSGALFFNNGLQPRERARFSVLLVALVAYWSPFVAIGLSVFVLADLCSGGIGGIMAKIIRNWWIYLFSLCLVLPYYLYISRALGSVPHGWAYPNLSGFFFYYSYRTVFEWLTLAVTVGMLAITSFNRKFMGVAIGLLVLLPVYDIGIFKDLSLRGALMGYYFLLTVAADGGLHILRHVSATDEKAGQRLARLTIAAVALLAAAAGPVRDTAPVVETLSGRHFPSPVKAHEFLPPFTVGLQKLMTLNSIMRDNGLSGQYMAGITPMKEKILKPMETCTPE